MRKTKMNDQGMTLIETIVCFVILGILMVVAAQIIHSSTEVYYNTKTVSNGVQAAQMVATEIRGEIEDALPLFVKNNDTYYMIIGPQKNSIEFIDANGNDVKYSLALSADGYVLRKETTPIYETQRLTLLSGTFGSQAVDFDSEYIGLGYTVKDIEFSIHRQSTYNVPAASNALPISDCPVLEVKITVGNKKYDDFTSNEYIALYNYSGIDGVNTRISGGT